MASTLSWNFLRVFSEGSCLNSLPKKACVFTVDALLPLVGRAMLRMGQAAGATGKVPLAPAL